MGLRVQRADGFEFRVQEVCGSKSRVLRVEGLEVGMERVDVF